MLCSEILQRKLSSKSLVRSSSPSQWFFNLLCFFPPCSPKDERSVVFGKLSRNTQKNHTLKVFLKTLKSIFVLNLLLAYFSLLLKSAGVERELIVMSRRALIPR